MYIVIAAPICFRLLTQAVFLADSLARAKTGKSRAARIAMMAMTTKSSINVKALRLIFILRFLPIVKRDHLRRRSAFRDELAAGGREIVGGNGMEQKVQEVLEGVQRSCQGLFRYKCLE